MKNVLIINGHPDKDSYNYSLADSYLEGLGTTDAIISRIDIADLNFNPNLAFGYRKRMELEPDLLQASEKIKLADHIVWVFPVWWYSYPAMMKGFIDRLFLPGITYQPIEGKPFPKKLLKGKSGHIIVTSDTPRWYDWLFMKSPVINQFKKGTLEFCGIGPVRVTYIAPIKNSHPDYRKKWLDKVFTLGQKQK